MPPSPSPPPPPQCSKHQDCRRKAPYCIAGKCSAKCNSDRHCKGLKHPKPYCLDGMCRPYQCMRDKHCQNIGSHVINPYCVNVNGTLLCRECNNDDCCSNNKHLKACHRKTGTCVQCTKDAHCAALAASGALGSGASAEDFACTSFRCSRAFEPQTNITECATNSDCGHGTGGTICNNGRCVECATAADCTPSLFGNAAAICQSGSCVECSSNTDCEHYKHPFGPTPVCSAGRCVECTGSSTCQAGLFGAQGNCQQGKCVECNRTADCPKDHLKPGGVCDQSSLKCVQCMSSDDCVNGICQDGVCFECSQEVPCMPGLFGVTGTCLDGQCVECSRDAECMQFQYPLGPKLTCAAGKCVECSADTPCAHGLFGANATCQAGRCVECSANKACPKDGLRPGGVCQELTAKCIQCKVDADCGLGTCQAGICQECITTEDCAPGLFNITGTCQANTCVECSSNADCAQFAYAYGPLMFAPICSTGKCVECSSDVQCPPGLWGAQGSCKAGKCVECQADADCPKKLLQPGGICQTDAGLPSYGKCVQCRTKEHCKFALHPGKTLVCAVSEGSCEVCMADSDCAGVAGVDGMGPYCVRGECSTKGKPCAVDVDCAYGGPCYGVASCPNATCVQGLCDSGLLGLDSLELGV